MAYLHATDYGVHRRARGRTVNAAAWSPARLGSDLLARWDAENADSITQSGGTVSAWADTANGYTPVQATGASQPAYSATGFGGRPELTFDATDDYLELVGVPALIPTGAEPCEIWALVRQDALVADAGARQAFAYGAGAVNARRIDRTVDTGVNRARGIVGDNSTGNPLVEPTVDFSGVRLVRLRADGTTEYISVDGGAETSTPAVPATATDRLRIGASSNPTANGFWHGGINAIIVTAPLSAAKAADLETYLLART